MSAPGSGTQRTGADYANIALGATSLIKGLTNKKPKALKPVLFTGNVRPAQGDEEGLKRTKNEIAGQVAGATADVTKIAGSDVNAGLNARVNVQKNANNAIITAEGKNSDLLRADQNRVSDELNRKDMINTQIQNDVNQYNNQIDQGNYQATQQASAAGVQSAIQYEANRSADIRSKRSAENSANQFVESIDQAAWHEAYNNALKGGAGTHEAAKQIADQALKERSLSKFKTNNYAPRSGGFLGLGRLFGRKIANQSVQPGINE